jgi:hypothetical protein
MMDPSQFIINFDQISKGMYWSFRSSKRHTRRWMTFSNKGGEWWDVWRRKVEMQTGELEREFWHRFSGSAENFVFLCPSTSVWNYFHHIVRYCDMPFWDFVHYHSWSCASNVLSSWCSRCCFPISEKTSDVVNSHRPLTITISTATYYVAIQRITIISRVSHACLYLSFSETACLDQRTCYISTFFPRSEILHKPIHFQIDVWDDYSRLSRLFVPHWMKNGSPKFFFGNARDDQTAVFRGKDKAWWIIDIHLFSQ